MRLCVARYDTRLLCVPRPSLSLVRSRARQEADCADRVDDHVKCRKLLSAVDGTGCRRLSCWHCCRCCCRCSLLACCWCMAQLHVCCCLLHRRTASDSASPFAMQRCFLFTDFLSLILSSKLSLSLIPAHKRRTSAAVVVSASERARYSATPVVDDDPRRALSSHHRQPSSPASASSPAADRAWRRALTSWAS